MSFGYVLLILLTGIVAGFLNTVGGGGSLLSMPMLIFLGLPSAAANGTNRVALMVQNLVAVLNFRQKGYFNYQLGLLLGIPAVIGSLLGAHFAIALPDELFNKILAIVMLIVLVVIIWRPEQKLRSTEEAQEDLSPRRRRLAVLVFFLVGFYGGFIQAGVGFVIIASLTVLSGMSLVRINSMKVFVVALYMLSSLAVFIYNGKVHWVVGLTLAAGNGLGAYLGSNFAVAKGDKWIRVILVVTVLFMAAKLVGFTPLKNQ